MDTFTHVVVFHGAQIASWRRDGYHQQEQYESLRVLLQAPQEARLPTLLSFLFLVNLRNGICVSIWLLIGSWLEQDAQFIMKDRFPVPRFIDCDEYGSQARFLLAKLNPSVTHSQVHTIFFYGLFLSFFCGCCFPPS